MNYFFEISMHNHPSVDSLSIMHILTVSESVAVNET